MRKIVFALCLAIVLSSSHALAWWSVPANFYGSTHHRITSGAEQMAGSAYPDVVEKFGANIANWTSGSSDDAEAHGGSTAPNGGDVGIWFDNALNEYKLFNFSGEGGAYYYIALLTHLTQDQGVPAHAWNIQHGGIGYMDNMEQLVNYHYGAINGIEFANSPVSNYRALMSYTLSATGDEYWRQYWVSSSPYTIFVDMHDVATEVVYNGLYGGPLEECLVGCDRPLDVFPSSWESAGNKEQDLSIEVTSRAVDYTAGALIAVSKSLPALIKDLDITPTADDVPAIDLESGNQINFHLLDNRSKKVKVFITVDSPTGDPIIETEYGTGKEIELSAGTDLPWEKDISITWDGKLSNGNYPSFGEHELYVRVEDEV